METPYPVIRTIDIGKEYGSLRAVDSVSLQVEKGELFGLIGPDGAGKTSLLRILATLLLPDKGQAEVCGKDVVEQYRQIRRQIGYMPGRFSLYPDMTVEENLNFFASLFGTTLQENYSLIEDIYRQIEPFKNRRAAKLSGGMKQKLALCCALIHRPEVLLLDEPTTGVDVVSRKEFWEMLRRLKNEGIAILVSTPYMDEATLCERIALMEGGRILKCDTPQRIMDDYPETLWAVRAERMPSLLGFLRQTEGIKTCFSFGDVHHATVDESVLSIEKLENALQRAGYSRIFIEPIAPSIEDCYMLLSSTDHNPQNR